MNVPSRGPGLKATSCFSPPKSDNEYVNPPSCARGTNVLGAQVTLGSPDHVALIAFALFNVSVPRTEIPEDWRFEEVWVDGEGLKVDGELEVEVTQYDSLKETRTNVD